MENMDPVPMPMQPQPVQTRELSSIGTLFSSSWHTYTGLFGKLFALMAIMFVANLLPIISRVFEEKSAAAALSNIIFGLASVFLGLIASIGILSTIVDNSIATGVALRNGSGLLVKYVWAGFLVGLVVLGGFLLLFIPGIIMSIMLGLTAYVVVVERKKGLDALTQSWHYVKGHGSALFWRMFVIGLVFAAFIIAVTIFLGPEPAPAGSPPAQASVAYTIVVGLISVALQPWLMIYTYMMYSELKQMKGDMDATESASRRKKLVWLIVLGVVGSIILLGALIAGVTWLSTHSVGHGAASGLKFMSF
jgi:hypothetical protein